MAATNRTNGFTFGLAPDNAGIATDVTGLTASATASFNSGANAFSNATTATSLSTLVSPRQSAPVLVTIPFSKTPSPGPFLLNGNLHPLSYGAPAGSYGSIGAGAGNFNFIINFGGSTQELFYQVVENGVAEFASGIDRVYTLSGATESLPRVTYGTAWSATHAFDLTFNCFSCGTPNELRGNVGELGNFGTTAGAPVTGINPVTATVNFNAGVTKTNFTSTPLAFKMFYTTGAVYEIGTNHTMNDDVINRRLLIWNGGDNSTF
jgi:hypothetical protein